MTSPLYSSSRYRRIFVIDTQLILEGKPITALPWSELDPEGPVLLLLVPTVLKEVDAKKRDGRLGTRARQFNRLISEAVDHGVQTIIEKSPQVDIAICICDRIDWNKFDDLDPNEADSRIVAESLHARDVAASQLSLLSYDANPRAMATRHGLKTIRPPDDWLMPPEPGPSEKENQRLKSRIAQLEQNEPKLTAQIEIQAAEPFPIVRVQELVGSEKAALKEEIIRQNPKVHQRRDYNSYVFDHDSSYDGKYNSFVRRAVPKFVENFARGLQDQIAQLPIVIAIRNTGEVRAENLVVEIFASGCVLNQKPILFPHLGPVAPKPRPRPYLAAPLIDRSFFVPRSVGRHEMELEAPAARSGYLKAVCEDFRHGQEWEFAGVVILDPNFSRPATIRVDITAGNMRGRVSSQREIRTSVGDASCSDIIDFGSMEWRKEPLSRELIAGLLAEERIDELEVERFDGEDD